MIWYLSLITGAIVAVPWLLVARFFGGAVAFVASFLLSLLLYFLAVPSLAGPLYGGAASIVASLLLVNAILALVLIEKEGGKSKGPLVPAVFGVVGLVIHVLVWASSWPLFRAQEYAALVGQIDVRDWSEDFQPKDPKHFRASSTENALFMAGRAVGQGTVVVGGQQRQISMSQFRIDDKISSIQIIRNELWTIVPLDWTGWQTQTSATQGVPGYMKVHGEDPMHPAQFVAVKPGRELKYTPGAVFSYNLERLVWNAHPFKVIADIHMEVDDGEDGGTPHYVVSLAEPTIGWSGLKVVGSVIVNPADGSGVNTFYPLGQEPAWVDRVMAPGIVHDNIAYHGLYSGGWGNRNLQRVNTNVATETHFGFGSDGQPVLATGIASHPNTNSGGATARDSLLGVYYTDTRTGRTTEYRMPGGATEKTCLEQVNLIPTVRNGSLHGSTPQLYNVYGHKAYVIPTQNATHAFAGVAICDIDDVQLIAWGPSAYESALAFKQRLMVAGSQIGIEGANTRSKVSGLVARVGSQMINGQTTFFVLVDGIPHLFTGTSQAAATLPVTQPGDTVEIDFIDSKEEILPISAFTNRSVALETSEIQAEVRQRATARIEAVRNPNEDSKLKALLDRMNPNERALLERNMKQK